MAGRLRHILTPMNLAAMTLRSEGRRPRAFAMPTRTGRFRAGTGQAERVGVVDMTADIDDWV